MGNKRLSREELLELVVNICNATFDSEEEYEAALESLEINVPDQEAANLFRQINPELTPEEIVEKALAYKPIITPPPPKNV